MQCLVGFQWERETLISKHHHAHCRINQFIKQGTDIRKPGTHPLHGLIGLGKKRSDLGDQGMTDRVSQKGVLTIGRILRPNQPQPR